MPLITAIPFYAAVAAYCVSAAIVMMYVRSGSDSQLNWSKHTAALGNTLLLVVFLYRWIHYGLVPFTGLGDSLNLLLIMCAGIILFVQRDQTMRPVMTYYMPALALLAIVSGVFSPPSLSEPPKELNGLFLAIHVGLIFFAFALFIVASITSIAYVSKAQSLKRVKTNRMAQRLPSLERIDKTLYGLIGVGYPAFAVTLVLGFARAYEQRAELGEGWWISPRIVLALVMVIFYASCFHLRRAGIRRGPKLAYAVFFMSLLLFLSYLGIELLQMGGYAPGGETP